MRWVKLFLRILGWLLTPFVAWAASFIGGWLGSLVAARMDDPVTGLVITVTAGILGCFTALLLWMRLLRRSPRLRRSLGVTREGIPLTPDLLPEGAPPEPAKEPEQR